MGRNQHDGILFVCVCTCKFAACNNLVMQLHFIPFMSESIFIVHSLHKFECLTHPKFDHTVSDPTLDGDTPCTETTLYMNGLRWGM